jgi:hypothetical protein
MKDELTEELAALRRFRKERVRQQMRELFEPPVQPHADDAPWVLGDVPNRSRKRGRKKKSHAAT